MMRVVNKWDRGISEVLSQYDTTRPQIELLTCVAKLMKDGQPVTQKEVVDFVGRDKNTVSAVLKTLEKKGYVTRVTSTGDSRSKAVMITDKGFRLFVKAAGEVMLFDDRFFPDEGDSEELRRLLRKYF